MTLRNKYNPPEDLRDKYGPTYQPCGDDIYMRIQNEAVERIIKCTAEPSSIELALYVIAKLGLDPMDVEPIEELVALHLPRDPQSIARYLARKARKNVVTSTRWKKQVEAATPSKVSSVATRMTDQEIVAHYEELLAATGEREISIAEWGRRQKALSAFMDTSAYHRRVICDAYAREVSNEPSPKTPGLGQETVDFVIKTNAAAEERGRISLWAICVRPKGYPCRFYAQLVELGPDSHRETRDIVADELESLRETFRAAGMACLDDEIFNKPHIVETWM